MFPLKQKFHSVSFAPVYDEVEERTDDGTVIMVRKIDQKPLPSPHLFDLEKQIEAGVNLQQVNTKILTPDVSPLVDALNEPWSNNNNNNNNNNNGVNNEN